MLAYAFIGHAPECCGPRRVCRMHMISRYFNALLHHFDRLNSHQWIWLLIGIVLLGPLLHARLRLAREVLRRPGRFRPLDCGECIELKDLSHRGLRERRGAVGRPSVPKLVFLSANASEEILTRCPLCARWLIPPPLRVKNAYSTSRPPCAHLARERAAATSDASPEPFPRALLQRCHGQVSARIAADRCASPTDALPCSWPAAPQVAGPPPFSERAYDAYPVQVDQIGGELVGPIGKHQILGL